MQPHIPSPPPTPTHMCWILPSVSSLPHRHVRCRSFRCPLFDTSRVFSDQKPALPGGSRRIFVSPPLSPRPVAPFPPRAHPLISRTRSTASECRILSRKSSNDMAACASSVSMIARAVAHAGRFGPSPGRGRPQSARRRAARGERLGQQLADRPSVDLRKARSDRFPLAKTSRRVCETRRASGIAKSAAKRPPEPAGARGGPPRFARASVGNGTSRGGAEGGGDCGGSEGGGPGRRRCGWCVWGWPGILEAPCNGERSAARQCVRGKRIPSMLLDIPLGDLDASSAGNNSLCSPSQHLVHFRSRDTRSLGDSSPRTRASSARAAYLSVFPRTCERRLYNEPARLVGGNGTERNGSDVRRREQGDARRGRAGRARKQGDFSGARKRVGARGRESGSCKGYERRQQRGGREDSEERR